VTKKRLTSHFDRMFLVKLLILLEASTRIELVYTDLQN